MGFLQSWPIYYDWFDSPTKHVYCYCHAGFYVLITTYNHQPDHFSRVFLWFLPSSQSRKPWYHPRPPNPSWHLPATLLAGVLLPRQSKRLWRLWRLGRGVSCCPECWQPQPVWRGVWETSGSWKGFGYLKMDEIGVHRFSKPCFSRS